MPHKTITFLSSRSRGMSPDLKLVKSSLSAISDSVVFRYYVNNEVSANYMVKQGVQYAKNRFCQDLSHIICIDGSLPAKLETSDAANHRLLIAAPYDYQFKNALSLNAAEKPAPLKTFRQFTHILPGSPFTRELLQNAYALDGAQLLDQVCTPLAWDINQADSIQTVRDAFLPYFPQMRGKKILSILTAGKPDKDAPHPFEQFDLKKLVKALGEDWFLFTNNPELMECAASMSAAYSRSFGYVDHVQPSWHLLYLSDTLITNHSMLASCFASRRRPVYCLQYKENAFETYVRQTYPELMVTAETIFTKNDLMEGAFTDAHQRFCRTFSYAPETNPLEVIQNLFSVS